MDRTRHSHTTLPHALGELELCVLEHVWQTPGLNARQIAGDLSVNKPTALSTIQTTLERLVVKGHLARQKQSHAYIYSAKVSRAEFLGNMLRDVIHLLHDGRANTILNSFVNVAVKLDETALDELENLIKEKRKEMGKKS